MKDTKPVKDQKYNADGAVVDPVGTVYFTASSASGKNRIEDYDYEWLDFKYVSEEPSYSTIEFTKNSFTLKTYGVDSKKQIDECKIVKTDTTYTPVETTLVIFTTYLATSIAIWIITYHLPR